MANSSERFYDSAQKELLTTIQEYESDTFSASACELTKDEAMEIAGRAIHWFLDNILDGVKLDDWLSDIR